jgi:hypothetical protein
VSVDRARPFPFLDDPLVEPDFFDLVADFLDVLDAISLLTSVNSQNGLANAVPPERPTIGSPLAPGSQFSPSSQLAPIR